MKANRMLRLGVIITVTFCVTACSPSSKLRKAERLIEQAIAKGGKVDSTKYVRYDSVEIKAFRDAFKTQIDVNPTFILEKCKELAAAKPESLRPIIVEVQERICPDIKIDTTYQLNIDSPKEFTGFPFTSWLTQKGGQRILV